MKLFKNSKSDGRHREAKQYNESFTPKDGLQYDWVYEYSLRQYNDASDAVRELDHKADAMIKYLVPGSSILGLALAFITTEESINSLVICGIGVGILLLVVALVFACKALFPTTQGMAPSIKDAIDVNDYYEKLESAKGAIACGINVAVSEKILAAEKKSRCIKWSYIAFVYALIVIFLITPAFYIIY